MKKFFFLGCSAIILLACNDNKSSEGKTSTKGIATETPVSPDKQAVDEIRNAKGDLDKIREGLEKLAPLEANAVKSLLPHELMEATQQDVDVSDAMGTQVATARYPVNDTVTVKLEIIDAGGPGGAGLFTAQYANMLTENTDDEDQYTKAINFKGGKALESCEKVKNNCSLTWFDGKRFIISLHGENTGIEKLKSLAGNIDTNR